MATESTDFSLFFFLVIQAFKKLLSFLLRTDLVPQNLSLLCFLSIRIKWLKILLTIFMFCRGKRESE